MKALDQHGSTSIALLSCRRADALDVGENLAAEAAAKKDDEPKGSSFWKTMALISILAGPHFH